MSEPYFFMNDSATYYNMKPIAEAVMDALKPKVPYMKSDIIHNTQVDGTDLASRLMNQPVIQLYDKVREHYAKDSLQQAFNYESLDNQIILPNYENNRTYH